MSKDIKNNHVIADMRIYSPEIKACLNAFKAMGATAEDLDKEFEKMMMSPAYLMECLEYITIPEPTIH
jgi:hypothetical protein